MTLFLRDCWLYAADAIRYVLLMILIICHFCCWLDANFWLLVILNLYYWPSAATKMGTIPLLLVFIAMLLSIVAPICLCSSLNVAFVLGYMPLRLLAICRLCYSLYAATKITSAVRDELYVGLHAASDTSTKLLMQMLSCCLCYLAIYRY